MYTCIFMYKSVSIPLFVSLFAGLLFVFVFCLSQKEKEDVRPDLVRTDSGKPTPFTVRARDKRDLWGKCFLMAVP